MRNSTQYTVVGPRYGESSLVKMENVSRSTKRRLFNCTMLNNLLETIKTQGVYLIIAPIVVTVLGIGIPELLTYFFPNICWAPRIGGTMVGVAVFIQAFMSAHPDKFQKPLKSGLNQRQLLTHFSYLATIIGTLVWAWGDMISFTFVDSGCNTYF